MTIEGQGSGKKKEQKTPLIRLLQAEVKKKKWVKGVENGWGEF